MPKRKYKNCEFCGQNFHIKGIGAHTRACRKSFNVADDKPVVKLEATDSQRFEVKDLEIKTAPASTFFIDLGPLHAKCQIVEITGPRMFKAEIIDFMLK